LYSVSDGFGDGRGGYIDSYQMYPEMAVTPDIFAAFKDSLFMRCDEHSIVSCLVHPLIGGRMCRKCHSTIYGAVIRQNENVYHFGCINATRPWTEVPDSLEDEATGATADVSTKDDADDRARTIDDVQSVFPEERSRTIGPEEAAAISHELWTTNIEQLVRTGSHVLPSQPRQRIVVLTFRRVSTELDAALLQSPIAHDAIAKGVDLQPVWAHGAKIFVGGIGPEKLDAPGLAHLSPANVAIYEEDESELMDALRQLLPYRVMKRKPGTAGKCVVPDDLSLANLSSNMTSIITNAGGSQASCPETSLTEELVPSLNLLEYTVRNTFITFDDDNFSIERSHKALTV